MTQQTNRLARPLLTFTAALYTIGLLGYLVLRLLFGDGFWWLSLLNTFAHLLFLPLLPLFTLAALLRARLTMLRLSPLAVIGGLWFGGYFLPKPAPTVTGRSINLLTSNVWGNNHDLHKIEAWIRQTNADIVLLQEISPAYAKDSLPNLLDVYPYQFAQPDDRRWGGNITLSRFPIITAEYVDLKTPGAPIPQRLVVNIDGQRLAVYNVHMAWPVRERPRFVRADNFYLRVLLGYDDHERNEEITHLLRKLNNEPYPYIIGGDFNTSDQSATYNRLAATMHDSFREAGMGLGGSWPVSRARGMLPIIPPLIRIDYLWHSDGLRAIKAWQGQPIGSDHLPLHATLELVSGKPG
jgi:endonuclease/exonuclease/phosphatase (EEP) superfamily protein YafD